MVDFFSCDITDLICVLLDVNICSHVPLTQAALIRWWWVLMFHLAMIPAFDFLANPLCNLVPAVALYSLPHSSEITGNAPEQATQWLPDWDTTIDSIDKFKHLCFADAWLKQGSLQADTSRDSFASDKHTFHSLTGVFCLAPAQASLPSSKPAAGSR